MRIFRDGGEYSAIIDTLTHGPHTTQHHRLPPPYVLCDSLFSEVRPKRAYTLPSNDLNSSSCEALEEDIIPNFFLERVAGDDSACAQQTPSTLSESLSSVSYLL